MLVYSWKISQLADCKSSNVVKKAIERAATSNGQYLDTNVFKYIYVSKVYFQLLFKLLIKII